MRKPRYSGILKMADDLPTQIKKLKLRHPEWFEDQEALGAGKGPKTPDLGPSSPIVEAPRKAYWEHDDGEVEERSKR